MDIPIYDGGREIGRLALRREGLYTVLEAFLPAQKGLRRLWVSGGGKSAELGLCEPREDGLHFRRAYSRAAFEALPSPLERAALDAAPVPAKPAAPPPPPREAEDAGWLALPDGTLVCPARRLLALPCALRKMRAGLRLQRIGGQDYLVFHT